MKGISVDAEWTDWLDRCGPGLILFARQWTRNPTDAQDAVQEGLLRFWVSRHKVSDAKAHLYACVRRAALDRVRSDRRRLARETRITRQSAQQHVPIFADGLVRAERRAAIEKALMKLPKEQRLVIVMKIWGQLTFKQIAETLGIPPDTTASRYRYAMTALRGHLKEVEL